MEKRWGDRGSRVVRRLEVGAIFLFLAVTFGAALAYQAAGAARPQMVENSLAVTAQANAMPNQGWAPLTVYFSAYGSSSSGAEILKYEWDLDGNGYFDTDATQNAGYTQYTYTKPGVYLVNLRVSDSQNRYASDQVEINVRHPSASSVDYGYVFDDSQARRIDIALSQANWDLMWSDVEAKIETPAQAVVFGERLEQVGFRMRGQFSLRESRDKKPWKINTDAYIAGQEFHNLHMLVLVNSIGDPSLLREKLAYDMMRFAGVAASHMTFVELWIDITDDDAPAMFWGVYGLVERIDRKFLANRFGQESKDGNLYKASHAQRGPMDLIYYGERIEDYPTQNGQYAYGKMTNEEEADYSDIVALCRAVDNAANLGEADYMAVLEAAINVDDFLRYLAVVMVLDNWDSYPYTGNNFYLFDNPVSGRFEWIPWDLSWGGNPQSALFEREDPGLMQRAPMYDRVLAIEVYRRKYAAYIDLLARNWFNEANVRFQAYKFHQMIAPYVALGDRMFYGPNAMMPPEAFQNSVEELVEFARERNVYIQEVLGE